ncbi:methyltransferase domain-containing protein [Terriglobus aquaticus]|uniref:Methyltransferase domain-containing protein n=1 Tax=Terriglobus aquaticus TaxID=940139 RepID=A0ABW9KIF2_9BACT|nr:methyltransferase domain-containing protein [Terriglobus aquaticus]
MTFDERAHLTELMDEPCTYEEFRACLSDLARVNRWTRAYQPTLEWLQQVVRPGAEPIHIVDVGCGGGDMLREVERWAEREGIAVMLTGVDLNPYAARAAREFTPAGSRIEWVTADAFSFTPRAPIDCVISSLFTHHLGDDEIANFVRWMEQVASRGWFINDLHRERVPYFGFQVLATLMRLHPFVRSDGPVSIRRAFREDDWKRYLSAGGVSFDSVRVLPFRPARLCVARVKA